MLGLGNALVDLIAQTDDAYLVAQDMLKGAMTLIDEDRAEALYAARVDRASSPAARRPTPSSASPRSACSSAYIGKVKNDELGYAFADDIRATGVGFATAPAEHGPATGRCFVYVTPDGERTMNTFLGASTYLSPADVDEELVRAARFVYLEGYMWDRPAAKEAFRKAGRDRARRRAQRVALTLSDSFCVDRFRGEFIDLMRAGVVDTVFANTDEILSLYRDAASRRGARRGAARGRARRGDALGEGIGHRRRRQDPEVPAFPIARVVDTTGAGDMFAAGFLAGLARGADLETCARLGALAAAEIIQHLGARPLVSLAGARARKRLWRSDAGRAPSSLSPRLPAR